MAKKKSSFFADFKKFITRGNVVDMAVAVIIGGAFNQIVNGLVNYIINPFIGLFLDTGGLESLRTLVQAEELDPVTQEVTKEAVYIEWGTWIETIINFLIVAFCLFLILRVVMRTKSLLEAEENEKKALAEAKAAEEAAAKAAEEKAAAERAAAEEAEKQAKLEASILAQEELLKQIRDLMRK